MKTIPTLSTNNSQSLETITIVTTPSYLHAKSILCYDTKVDAITPYMQYLDRLMLSLVSSIFSRTNKFNQPDQWSLKRSMKTGLKTFNKINLISILYLAYSVKSPIISMSGMIDNSWIWIHVDRRWTPML